MRSTCAAALLASLTATPGFAQSAAKTPPPTPAPTPALTTDWTPISLTQAECLSRAEAAMRRVGLRRIERIGESVFADSETGRDQITIRCIADRQMAFVVAAGGDGSDQNTGRLVSMVLEAFRAAR